MQLLLDLAPPAPPTLDNFEPGGNAEVLSALRAWLDGEGRETCVYLWGPPGCGKSHLLKAAVSAAVARGRATGYYPHALPVSETVSHMQWLAVDDVNALDAADAAALFGLLNRAAAGELRVLLSGDIAPGGLRLRADVRTRIGAGLVLQVKPLSDEDKAQALCRHASARGFDLPQEAAQHLLHHGRRDLPSLIALLDAADRYSLRARRAVTLPLLREVLQLARDR